MTDSVKQYGVDLQAESNEHKRLAMDRKHSISSMRQHLQSLKHNTSQDTRCLSRHSAARVGALVRVHRQHENVLLKNLSVLSNSKRVEEMVHTATLTYLRKKHRSLAEDVVMLRSHREVALHSLEMQLCAVDQERTSTLSDLTVLRQRRAADEVKERQLEEANAQECKRSQCRVAEFHKRNSAALEIQSLVRIFLQQKAHARAVAVDRKGRSKRMK